MWTGLVGLFIGQFLGSGALTVLVKIGLTEFPPFILSAIRFIVAGLGLYILFAKRNRLSVKDSELIQVFKRSIFFAGNIAFFSVGLQYTTAIMSQIMYLALPIIVAVVAHFFLNEKITKTKIIGFIIAFSGICFLIIQSFQKSQSIIFGTPIGNFLIFCACLMWGLYVITSRKVAHKHSIIKTTFANTLFTAFIMCLLSPLQIISGAFHISHVTLWGVWSLIALGIGTVIQYIAIQYGIKHTNATTVSFFQYLAPLFAAVVAIPVLHEKVTLQLLIGGLLILLGVFYATTYPLLKKQKSAVQ